MKANNNGQVMRLSATAEGIVGVEDQKEQGVLAKEPGHARNLSIGLRSLLWTSLWPMPKTNWKFIVIGRRRRRFRKEGSVARITDQRICIIKMSINELQRPERSPRLRIRIQEVESMGQ